MLDSVARTEQKRLGDSVRQVHARGEIAHAGIGMANVDPGLATFAQTSATPACAAATIPRRLAVQQRSSAPDHREVAAVLRG